MQFTCPECQSLLEMDLQRQVDVDCPVCSTPLRLSRRPKPSASQGPSLPDEPPGQWRCLICDTSNEPNEGGLARCQFCEAPRPRRARSEGAVAAVPVPSSITLTEILRTTTWLFTRNFGLLAAIAVLEFTLFFAFLAPGLIAFVLLVQWVGINPPPGQALLVIFAMLAFVLLTWTIYQSQHAGHYTVMLKIARGERASPSDLFGHARKSLKIVLLSFVFAGVVLLGLVAAIVPGLVALALLWPYGRLIIDRDPPGFSSLVEAGELVRPHFLPVLTVSLVLIGLQYASSLAGPLVLLVAPYASLGLTVAYLRMRGEATAVDLARAQQREARELMTDPL